MGSGVSQTPINLIDRELRNTSLRICGNYTI